VFCWPADALPVAGICSVTVDGTVKAGSYRAVKPGEFGIDCGAVLRQHAGLQVLHKRPEAAGGICVCPAVGAKPECSQCCAD
jgi:hypothetical protein